MVRELKFKFGSLMWGRGRFGSIFCCFCNKVGNGLGIGVVEICVCVYKCVD